MHVFVETENVSLSHLHLAQTMREEAKKLEDFREKQKDTRKKVRRTASISLNDFYKPIIIKKCLLSGRATNGCSSQAEGGPIQENR